MPRRTSSRRLWYVLDSHLVRVISVPPSAGGAQALRVDGYQPACMAALGYFVTGLEPEPESRKQQRNGDMHCSSRRRQRAYSRRTRSGRAAK